MDALSELPDELAQDGRRRARSRASPASRGECEDTPAETVGERLGVALDVPVLGEGLECPRELALVVTAELCEPYDAQTGPSARRARSSSTPSPRAERCRSRVHRCIVPFACTKMQLGVNVETEQHGLSADERRVCDAIAHAGGRARRARAGSSRARHDDPHGSASRRGRSGAPGAARRPAARARRRGSRLGARPGLVAGHPMVPDGFTFAGRPQLVAPLSRPGGGRTLLLNGHIDVVVVDPVERWSHPPFAAVVEDGRVHGRGACDMKGGVASMVFAAETLARLGIRPRRRPDRQHRHRGGVDRRRRARDGADAAGRRGDRARAERPRRLGRRAAAASCRRSPSRVARATPAFRSARWDEGGAVNAIEKMALVLEAIAPAARALGRAARPPVPLARRLRADDRLRRRVDRLVPRLVPARLPHRVPPGAGGRARLGLTRRARVHRLDRHGRRRATRGSPRIRRVSTGSSAAYRRPRCPSTIRS